MTRDRALDFLLPLILLGLKKAQPKEVTGHLMTDDEAMDVVVTAVQVMVALVTIGATVDELDDVLTRRGIQRKANLN